MPRKKILAIVLVPLLLCFGTGVFVALHAGRENSDTTPGATARKASAANSRTIRLIATGDWIAHDSVNAAAKQPDGSYNYLPLVKDIQPIFDKGNIRFCNDPILNGGESLGIEGYPKFNSPTEFVTSMGSFGCNLVNTASNHSFDGTQANIDNSVAAWQKVPNMLAVAGENRSQAEHDTVHYFTVSGIKIAFLAYTTYINADAPAQNSYGVSVFSTDFANSQITEAKQHGAKLIIASMRWGTEYSSVVSDEQKQDAQWLADHGVNLILGHGPHVLQSVAQLTGSGGNKSTAWYSLGNFLNSQEPADTLFNGLAYIDISKSNYEVTNMQFLPVYMHYEWTAAQAAADDTDSRTHLHMYLLEDATQAMIDAQQLKTTVSAQKQRLTSTLTANGATIPLVDSKSIAAQQ